MKTEITKFCEAALEIVHTLTPAIQNTASEMERSGEHALFKAPLAVLNDLRAHLRSLTDKLASQQAYLLIFGPLKSGKSTLMNAISGAYVSEVTSLPGYPCLVFVGHAEQPHYSVTRYNGRESVFATGAVLKEVVEDSHVALAQQIRAAEQNGVAFDPRTHFTEAIRRIDVKSPISSLAESSTVLVDTPGLYSRMNFGYDVLTREFRDSAACAVFVVKTDNLFLEQVFQEFNQLLDLFSRIFLVINVDSSKRDLQADGSLTPSAESANPERIIEAFTTLSMAGPLRRAYEEKRLRIHAVDLMNAASSLLSNGHAPVDSEPRKATFNAFLTDLTDYLNGSEYTQEFIRDSLRQGHTICAEARGISECEEMSQLREKQAALDQKMSDLDERNAAVERLLLVDWDATFAPVREENAKRAEESARGQRAELTKKMSGALDRWYGTSESLQALEERHFDPLIQETALALREETRGRLTALLGNPRGGAEPPASAMTDLHAVGFPLAPVAISARETLDTRDDDPAYRMTLRSEDVPVRKTFADWILFRGQKTVGRRLFGEKLTSQIAPEEKAMRLPDASREAFSGIIRRTADERFPQLPVKHADRVLADYIARFREEVRAGLEKLRERLTAERAACQAPYEINSAIFAALQNLHDTATATDAGLDRLAQEENAVPAPAPLDPHPASSGLAEPAPSAAV